MPNRNKARLLIIDDEPELRETLAEMIRVSLDVVIETCEDALDGLDAVTRLRPHAILTDLKMPLMDGIQFVQNLRSRGIETPVVVLTAYADDGAILSALRSGASEFLRKPIRMQELVQSMTRALNLGIRMQALDHKLASIIGTDRPEFTDFQEERRTLCAARVASLSLRRRSD